jgi:UDP-glucose 4-epimerase
MRGHVAPLSLVTGGAGFIGSHVAESCLALGHDVVVVDDLSGGFEANVPAGATFVPLDITVREAVDELLEGRSFDYVYHLAAYAAEGLSHFIRAFNYTNNLIGSMHLLNASVRTGVRCFVFTSSIAVYGSAAPPMTEEMTPTPEDPYGIAKYAVELDLAAAHRTFGLDYVIFRPHNVYGERQNIADRYRNVLGIFMNQVMSGEQMTIFGDGEQTRAFSYISDVAPVIAASVDVPRAYNKIFNVGADRPYTVNELAHVVARAFGVKPDVAYLTARAEVVHAFSSHERVREVFGERETVDLVEGVERMTLWARRVGRRPQVAFNDVEVTLNMPPSWQAVVSRD